MALEGKEAKRHLDESLGSTTKKRAEPDTSALIPSKGGNAQNKARNENTKTTESACSPRGWHELSPVLWKAVPPAIMRGLPRDVLSPSWQLLIFGDGSPTHNFNIITRDPIYVEVLEMSLNDDFEADLDNVLRLIPTPRTRRQVWLTASKTNERVMYATSWWSTSLMNTMMPDQSKPIWSNLQGLDLFRDMQGVFCGHNKHLEEGFGTKGPFWGRYYFFWHRGEPLCFIYEVFSNKLSKYLGPQRQGEASLESLLSRESKS